MKHIITTGHTIEGVNYENPENKQKQSKITIKELIESTNLSLEYIIEKAFANVADQLPRKTGGFLKNK